MPVVEEAVFVHAKKAYKKLITGQPLTHVEQGYLWRCVIETLEEIDKATHR